MADLESQLRALEIDWPETPDIATAVRPRLAARRAPGRVLASRWRLVVAGALALVLGSVAAIEPARSAVLELLGLQSVRIERRVPPPPSGSGLDLGEPVRLAEARRRAGFNVTPPAALGEPAEVWIRNDHLVSFVYGRGDDLLLVSEALATVGEFIQKSAGPGVRIDEIREGGATGYFLSGAPHGFAYQDPRGNFGFEEQRLAGNTLVLERDGLLVRVEGDITKQRALQIARSVSATSAETPG